MADFPEARQQHLILGVVAFATFMALLDTYIVNISLPVIADSFHVDLGTVSWVIMAYMLTLTSFMLVFGKLGDIKGYRTIFILGFLVFSVMSLVCGMSPSIHFLIAARALQGVGAAALVALGPSMITVYLPPAMRGRAIGILAAVGSLAVIAGPVLGGFLTTYLGWHWIFLFNVPVGAIAILFALRVLPQDKPVAITGPFDIMGSVLFFLAIACTLLPVNKGMTLGWTSPVILLGFVLALALWAVFFRHELRAADPLLDPRQFMNRGVALGNLAGFLFNLVVVGAEFLIPFYLEGILRMEPDMAGLCLAVIAVPLLLLGPFAGALSDRIGTRLITTIAAGAGVLCLYLFGMFSATTVLWFIIIALLLDGIANALFIPANMSQILGAASGAGKGVSSGVMMTLRNLGSVMGIAIFGTVMIAVVYREGGAVPPSLIPLTVFIDGFHAAFMVGVVLCSIAMVACALAPDNKPAGHTE